MPKRNQLVVPHAEGWAVKKEGGKRPTAIFDTQGEAIEYGRYLARRQRSELVIYNRKGVERKRKNYYNYKEPGYSYYYDFRLGQIVTPSYTSLYLQNSTQSQPQDDVQNQMQDDVQNQMQDDAQNQMQSYTQNYVSNYEQN